MGDFHEPSSPWQPYQGFHLSVIDDDVEYSAGFVLVVSQLSTKTYQGREAHPVSLRPQAEPIFCFVQTLAL